MDVEEDVKVLPILVWYSQAEIPTKDFVFIIFTTEQNMHFFACERHGVNEQC
jgi:hypothetical protein